jgi:hypothetical protein
MLASLECRSAGIVVIRPESGTLAAVSVRVITFRLLQLPCRGTRLLNHVLAVCLLAAVLAAPRTAEASGPWCDSEAQTIAAPPPVMPRDFGEISAWKDCRFGAAVAVDETPPARDGQQAAAPEAPDKATVTSLAWPPSPGSQRLITSTSDEVLRPGFPLPVYKPPRLARSV